MPPEIHFQLCEGLLEDIRFVGGGSTGNAQLVSRLIKGRPVKEVRPLLSGIDCRNGTSCSDQLSSALKAAENGRLAPVDSFRIYHDATPHHRIGFMANLSGDDAILKALLDKMVTADLDIIYCLGNLTGKTSRNTQFIQMIRKQKIPVILGETDWQMESGKEPDNSQPLNQKSRDWLLRLPHVMRFKMEGRTGMAFYGDYIQNLPGYSDFDPFALEMNMVCGLTNFMQSEAVFPALTAMTPQFEADIILFSQAKKWGHWHVAEKNFISLGPAVESKGLSWGLLETNSGEVRFEQITIDA